jgi:hypothetical protein
MSLIRLAVRKIDKFFFTGRIKTVHEIIKIYKVSQQFRSNSGYFSITQYYKKNSANVLGSLCDLYGSDKGEGEASQHPYTWPSHSYTDYYWRIFANSRETVKKVLEIGIGTNNPNLASSMDVNGKPGASLRVWKDFFPNAMIYGADIDREILFKDERITTAYMNQLDSKSIIEFFELINQDEFDFICDDGLHTFEAGSILFTFAFGKLASNGVYVIEDVKIEDFSRYEQFFSKTNLNVDFVTLHRPGLELNDNSLIVVKKG